MPKKKNPKQIAKKSQKFNEFMSNPRSKVAPLIGLLFSLPVENTSDHGGVRRENKKKFATRLQILQGRILFTDF